MFLRFFLVLFSIISLGAIASPDNASPPSNHGGSAKRFSPRTSLAATDLMSSMMAEIFSGISATMPQMAQMVHMAPANAVLDPVKCTFSVDVSQVGDQEDGAQVSVSLMGSNVVVEITQKTNMSAKGDLFLVTRTGVNDSIISEMVGRRC